MTAEESEQTGDGQAMELLQREAQAWVVRLGSHQVTDEDAQAFKRWCAQSRSHANAFVQAREVWRAMASAALQVRRQDERNARTRMPVAGRRAFLGGAVAASVAYLAVRPPLELWPSVTEWGADYRTATGEQREVAMADGVVLQMNTQTRVNVLRGSESGEGIELLAGEAEIATQASARVTVSAADGVVSAVRARFNIRNTDGEVCVTCIAGQVEVARGAQRLPLDEGRQLRYGAAGLGAVMPVDIGPVTAWRRRQLVFDQVPLAQVVAEVNRYRRGRLVLTSEALGRSLVQASFSIDRLDDVASLVREVYGAELTQLPGGIVLLGQAKA
ncbi:MULTISPECIES: FecR family protein [unclassified Variovorax]|uniref:FecR family protein n=1 Tax=unclassified Variovorax TaxID=663243 RepID=UPI000D1388CE|nr:MULTISPECIES: FecR domain-containing protein [unclassified Variovorax]AVQ85536.1 iron dicitrate transport regulator FecR [Variovorax sp. PMC12]QRY35159.1 FecR domain-containing protein [Variovorax sp. PDNC026]